jgi:hypothetical protein
MTAPAGHPALRARISDALANLLADLGGAEIARRVGTDRATPGRRGSDVAQWPLDCALRLAVTEPSLAAAIIDFLTGDQRPTAMPVDATRTMYDCLHESADLVAAVARDLADGRIDQDDARRLLPIARLLHQHLAALVVPSLESAARG